MHKRITLKIFGRAKELHRSRDCRRGGGQRPIDCIAGTYPGMQEQAEPAIIER